jgi:hypothetical protein
LSLVIAVTLSILFHFANKAATILMHADCSSSFQFFHK